MIVAFVAMMAVVLGLTLGLSFVLGVDAVLQPGRFDLAIVVTICAVPAGVWSGGFSRALAAKHRDDSSGSRPRT